MLSYASWAGGFGLTETSGADDDDHDGRSNFLEYALSSDPLNGRDPANPKFSDHCFTGTYPTHLTDQTQVEPQPRQLSLLAEAS